MTVLGLQRQVLATLKRAAQPLQLVTLAEKAGAADQVETVYKIVRHLAANQRDVNLHGDRANSSSLTISAQ